MDLRGLMRGTLGWPQGSEGACGVKMKQAQECVYEGVWECKGRCVKCEGGWGMEGEGGE